MWIRGQDKKTITKIITVTVETTKNGTYTIRGFNENSKITYMYLGAYSTEEKVLKVLDMIDYALQGLVLLSNGKVTHTPETKVFQMPQDNEV